MLFRSVRRDLDALRHTVAVALDRISRRIARPLDHVIDVQIPALGRRVTQLERYVRSIPVRHIAAGAAAGTSALALVRALGVSDTRTARTCAPKLRGMCTTDPVAWASLMESLTALSLAWTLLDIVRQAQDLARPIARELDRIVRT